MNERIKELAEQCYDPEHGFIIPEKFAELIILECVNSVMDGTMSGDHYAMKIESHFNNSQGGILHFGVEE